MTDTPEVAKPKRPRSPKQIAAAAKLKEFWAQQRAGAASKPAAPEAPKHASSDPPVAVPRSAGDPPKATERAPEAKAAEKPKPKSFFQSIGFS